jgi:hypothetical protein
MNKIYINEKKFYLENIKNIKKKRIYNLKP